MAHYVRNAGRPWVVDLQPIIDRQKSEAARREADRRLEDALEESFPASDPPSVFTPD